MLDRKLVNKKSDSWTRRDKKSGSWTHTNKQTDVIIRTSTGATTVIEVKKPSAGKTLLWASRLSPMSVIEESKHGISAKVLGYIQKETGFSSQELAEFLQINMRTMQRYLQQNTLMNPDVSERALLVAQIAERGREIYGSDESFRLWLDTPSVALGGVKPGSLLSTISGIQLVRAELGRIEYGVF